MDPFAVRRGGECSVRRPEKRNAVGENLKAAKRSGQSRFLNTVVTSIFLRIFEILFSGILFTKAIRLPERLSDCVMDGQGDLRARGLYIRLGLPVITFYGQ